MKKLSSLSSAAAFFTVLCVILFLGSVVFGAAPVKQELSENDCVKCHAGPPADIAADGRAHKEVGCQGCHAGHPPTVKHPIPECTQCHMGKPHFELKGCLNCHTNPHTPRRIVLKGEITEACLSCHNGQIKQLKENPSKHTALACTTCHAGVHPTKPECTKCHKPHSSDMTAANCKQCHKAHMPKNVMYGDVESKLCAACHKTQMSALNASEAKHKIFNCAFCHKDKHKAVPHCKDCHGEKHPAGIMAKFPKCYDCHKVAHDLNNWSVPAKAEPGKKAEPAREVKEPAKKAGKR